MDFPSRDINNLTAVVKRGCEEFLKRCEKQGLKVKVTETFRSAEYQASLYAQGRTKKGSIITNLSGKKGQESPHQFRIAFDICQNIKNNAYPARLPASRANECFWQRCGKIWRDMGGTWGGDWKSFVDNPHFEFTDNKGYAPFRNGFQFPATQKMKWENEIVLEKKEEPKKEDLEMVGIMKISINGTETAIPSILKDGRNYPDLRELAKVLGMKVDYDENKKMVVLKKE